MDLSSLVKRRGSLKARLTHFKKYLDKIQGDQATEVSLNDVEIQEFQFKISRFEQIINEFDEIQNNIEVLSENVEEQYDERDAFEQEFSNLLAQAKSLLSINTKNDLSVHSGERDESEHDLHARTFRNVYDNVKLPTIKLPTFGGSYEDWFEFKETYDSLIHTNDMLKPIQKYHYLRASLTDKAAQVIKALEFTSNNYIVAYDTLANRFSNPRAMVNNHVKALFKLENIKAPSSDKLRQLNDDVSKHLNALELLKNKGEDLDLGEILVVNLVISKLDCDTFNEWERHRSDIDVPNVETLKGFMKKRADYLESVEDNENERKQVAGQQKSYFKAKDNKRPAYTRGLHVNKLICDYCKNSHYIFYCPDFLKLNTQERLEATKKLKLCINCLKSGHLSKQCNYGSCKFCQGKHNTLLHIASKNQIQSHNAGIEGAESENSNSQVVSLSSSCREEPKQALLATAVIKVVNSSGKSHKVVALLDSGSQSSFISENICNKLNLHKKNINIRVTGINETVSEIKYKCTTEIQSIHNAYQSNVTFLVVPEITDVPGVSNTDFEIPPNIKLANPAFKKFSKIDVLLGGDLFWDLLCVGRIPLGAGKPVLQKTRLGWVIVGPMFSQAANKTQCNFNRNMSTKQIQNQLADFWEIEECLQRAPKSKEENACEQHFVKNTRRADDGRFIVSLPFKESTDNLGESKESALRRFSSLEKKLLRDTTLQKRYTDFLDEYLELNHMTHIGSIEEITDGYFMPHHGVIREDSTSTKLRVVFDASAVTTSGKSLNNLQMVGPILQEDLRCILLRFRQHRVVVSADIAKMYRMVLVEPSQRCFQRIVWRDNPDKELQVYQLNTVTYGTAAASFLAIRCLFELAKLHKETSPVISAIIERDFYVDDFLSGSDTVQGASEICAGVTRVLQGGGFQLHKWKSNFPECIKKVTDKDSSDINLGACESSKTLGLLWSCSSDQLFYKIGSLSHSSKITKRSMLSIIAQIFDPLGLLSPVTILAKIMLQDLWKEKLSWDESVPLYIHNSFKNFKDELPILNNLRIARHVVCERPISIELHGFCDASENAYGASLYIRSFNKGNQVHNNLLCSKSRVAPIKSLTIPRLELCGALLLAKLSKVAIDSLTLKFDKITLWSDSTIVLGWLRTSPHLLKTFVNNRVAEIQQLTDKFEWRHIPSKENPSDLITRGLNPSKIHSCKLWWHGPSFLQNSNTQWPDSISYVMEELPELKTIVLASSISKISGVKFEHFNKFSNYKRVLRSVAWIFRFIHNCRKPFSERTIGALQVEEINKALNYLIQAAQSDSFSQDIHDLKQNGHVKLNSKVANLNPFIDSSGILRVGGRLELTDFSYDKKHPIILSSDHLFTKLLFKHNHDKLLHVGPQGLLASIREKFWPIRGKNLAKQTYRECLKCFRFNSKDIHPIMGNLPSARASVAPPFYTTGLDYGGPFNITDRRGRGCKITKCWICLFVCFATKAVHIELVSSLSSDSFILTIRRFIARRGLPAHIYSDNATTFIGANNELENLTTFFKTNQNVIENTFSADGVRWHFIPAHSPHFGGIWEAGIKSIKHHLKRVVGETHLTFEEFSTLLAQIEAILNSRPLSQMSSHPQDLNPITPAHFLVGRPLTALPEHDLRDIPCSRLSRYEHMQHMLQHIWQRWSKEYVSEMQQRTKWKQSQGELKADTLVLIKEDNQPPLRWRLGRVLQLHPGQDNIARVASVRTANGVVKRSFAKLCPLPVNI